MPILKVSESMSKYARSGIRLPVVSEPIDNCPKCGIGGYRDGICSNATTCGYIDPRQLEAEQAWQAATQTQAAVENHEQQNEGKKAASKIALSETPEHYPNYFQNNQKTICKACGELSLVDGGCANCGYEIADPRLDDPKVNFTGIGITDRRIKIPPTYEVFSQSKSKKKTKSNHKKKKTHAGKMIDESIIKLNANKGKALDPEDVDPGAMLDDSIILGSEPIVRAMEMMDTKAHMDAQQKIDEASQTQSGGRENNDDQETNSEELQ